MRLHEPQDHYSYYCSQAGRGYNSFPTASSVQFGGSVPTFNVFRGVPSQRGYGVLSNVISRYGVPLVKYLAPKVFAKGKDIASDIYLRNRPPREAIRAHLKLGGKELLRDTLNRAASYTNKHFGQEGAGQQLHFVSYAGGKKRKRSVPTTRTATKRRRLRRASTKKKAKRVKKKKTTTVKTGSRSNRSSKISIFV